jgi:L-alanine-DL-glutamate epimerase-like enolase superfamily enzyme
MNQEAVVNTSTVGLGVVDTRQDTRIAEIRVYRHELPVAGGPYAMGHSVLDALDSTLVEIVTEDGLVGYGETCPVGPVYQPHHASGARAALAEMIPHLIGHDARRVLPARVVMDGALMGHDYAKAAIDIALWDLLGKSCGMRVCDLLGGALSERVPSYYSITVAEPDEAAERAVAKQAEGFGRLQLKVGGRPIEADLEAIRKVAAVLKPRVRLAVDANRTWTASEAISISRQCADLTLVLEQPCNSFEENATVSARVAHPVFLDEAVVDLRALVRAITEGVAQGFGLKLTRAGGVSGMRALRDVCDAYHMPHTCDDAWGGDVIAAACVHIAATVRPHLLQGAWIAAPHLAEHYDAEHPIAVRDGSIPVPTGIGLGVRPNVARWGSPVARFP